MVGIRKLFTATDILYRVPVAFDVIVPTSISQLFQESEYQLVNESLQLPDLAGSPKITWASRKKGHLVWCLGCMQGMKSYPVFLGILHVGII